MFLGCPSPPKGDRSTHKITFTHIDGEYWTDTRVEYECNAGYNLEWQTSEEYNLERVCTRDAVWDNNAAPICVPSLFYIIKLINYNFNSRIQESCQT